jgi:hypothetical protein
MGFKVAIANAVMSFILRVHWIQSTDKIIGRQGLERKWIRGLLDLNVNPVW